MVRRYTNGKTKRRLKFKDIHNTNGLKNIDAVRQFGRKWTKTFYSTRKRRTISGRGSVSEEFPLFHCNVIGCAYDKTGRATNTRIFLNPLHSFQKKVFNERHRRCYYRTYFRCRPHNENGISLLMIQTLSLQDRYFSRYFICRQRSDVPDKMKMYLYVNIHKFVERVEGKKSFARKLNFQGRDWSRGMNVRVKTSQYQNTSLQTEKRNALKDYMNLFEYVYIRFRDPSTIQERTCSMFNFNFIQIRTNQFIRFLRDILLTE